MNRRQFCRIAAAAAAMPRLARAADTQPSNVVPGFNKYTEDYAVFCARPERERVFYALENGQIISEKLTADNWNAESWVTVKPQLPIPGGSWQGVPLLSPLPGLEGSGPYQATWDSLLQYDVPEWYRDAKFGIWAHWSPQCVPEAGDWYANGMYGTNPAQYRYHLEHFGHPSKFGYKDLCAQWTMLNWEPDELMRQFKRAGARSSSHWPTIMTASIHGIRDISRGTRQISGPIEMWSEPGLIQRGGRDYASGSPFIRGSTGGSSSRRMTLTRLVLWQAFLTTESDSGRRKGDLVGRIESADSLRRQASGQCAARRFLCEELL